MMSAPKKGGPEALVALILLLPVLSVHGVILAALWGWFVAPLGAPVIDWKSATGLLIVLAEVRGTRRKRDDEEEDLLKRLLMGLATSLMALGMGAIIHALGGGR